MSKYLIKIRFALYTIVCVFHGTILGAFGPTLLYFSKVTHHDQTYFSFILFSKAIGFLLGGFIAKFMINRLEYHQIFIISIGTCGISLIVSSLDFGFWNLLINMAVIGASCCTFEIVRVLCVFKLFFKDDQEFWLQIGSIFFGLGGFIGASIPLYTEELTFRAIGILIFLCITPLIILPSPQKTNSQQEKQEKCLLQLPLIAEILLCILIFINIGLINAYPSWIPTYAVKSGEFNVKSANILVLIYWISQIIGKMTDLLMRWSIRQKSYLLLTSLLISGLITLFLQWMELYTICCYFGTITTGVLLAPFSSLLFTISQQYGYKLTASATANLTQAAILSEGILVATVGYIIGLLGFKSLIYSVSIINLLVYIVFSYLDWFLQKDSQQKKKSLEI